MHHITRTFTGKFLIPTVGRSWSLQQIWQIIGENGVLNLAEHKDYVASMFEVLSKRQSIENTMEVRSTEKTSSTDLTVVLLKLLWKPVGMRLR
ncbi:hypothetical protein M9H77_15354 [Catharanthus roseus]|uniref:Uncharacterized protein n=1 Tax=Catharanthus roseus TaxID=4058 RepID=A0ACC0AXL7_CATRO|nr:hypothetical protein M9H77_15354 [Catharanthus roseus]